MSKRDFYEILGVAKSATEDDIKKAYRKGAAKFHPDRVAEGEKAAAEEKFKELKEAYETLSDPHRRDHYDRFGHQDQSFQQSNWSRSSSSSEMDQILEALRRARGGFGARGSFKHISEVQAGISLKEAFEGFNFNVQMPDGSIKRLPIPPGVPDGYRSQHDINDVVSLIITVRINDPDFSVKNASECSWHQEVVNGRPMVVIETGDIETTVSVDALDILTGGWVNVTSFEGDQLQVRVPAGFNLNQRLKVKDRGYYHWIHDLAKPGKRGDLYVKVSPIFKAPKDLDFSKVEELFRQAAVYHSKPGDNVDVKA